MTAPFFNPIVNIPSFAPTTPGQHQENLTAIERAINGIPLFQPVAARVNTEQTTTSTSYADLSTVGPVVSVETRTAALAFIACLGPRGIGNNTALSQSLASVAVTGASSIAADDDDPGALCETVGSNQQGIGTILYFSTLTPGYNIFTMKYRVTAGTGNFKNRLLVVIPLGF